LANSGKLRMSVSRFLAKMVLPAPRKVILGMGSPLILVVSILS
jgi:hypothetical protein